MDSTAAAVLTQYRDLHAKLRQMKELDLDAVTCKGLDDALKMMIGMLRLENLANISRWTCSSAAPGASPPRSVVRNCATRTPAAIRSSRTWATGLRHRRPSSRSASARIIYWLVNNFSHATEHWGQIQLTRQLFEQRARG